MGEVTTTSLAVAISAAAAAAYIIQRQQTKKKPQKKLPFPTSRTPLKRVPLDELPELKNDLLLRALRGDHTERVPVWCMRQAGRHLPEFRELRDMGYDFFTMCGVPELAVEVSLQPLRRYHMDAVIIFSDILVIPQAMGMIVKMVPKIGPVLPDPIRTPEDIDKLNLNPDIDETLGYMLDALNLARQKINGEVPLIGFVGAPLTLMCYMIEGSGSRTKALLKTFLYQHPDAAHKLLQGITTVCVNFMLAQQRAGAQALQVFETVGAEALTQDHFYEFVYPYLVQIADRVKAEIPNTPLMCFCKGTQYGYEKLVATKYDCIGLDWQSDPVSVRQIARGRVSLQGNLDSSVIYASTDIIYDEVKKMLKRFGTQKYVANLGHGCFPDMKPAHVDAFIKAVQQISLEMNAR
ncbi:uroporphyrinogen decarboxylase [Plasmopara halstedii]|uniref:Uroporphyrinogen decarboxylase n=1 Tax=Plasmopara halstedii TaxID=4781 RepID=A0A0P1AG46_PLAHL|nr:uroporphyrinogen decarboxylase [Plasmopara halstedii]CEG39732.1 uroporphyrinogen decarboxylase [Plasmopara halstedii]|eukprot:XP_024576101.1 uroporphyrinogen decarboxylase [Plasmopara halstedii]